MSEQPTGLLSWGQGGIYDAIDDRFVIAAVTRNRTGLTWPIEARAGTGLQVIVSGGWLGVCSCGDRTSAVVGSRTDSTLNASPGPPTGSRDDVIWVDPEPDAGTWTMRVIPEAATAGRPGLLIGRIIVPANATLASQMDIRPVGASLERRLMMTAFWSPLSVPRAEGTWGDASVYSWATAPMPVEPGQWYKATFTANSPRVVTGSLEGRIGIGYRTEGQPPNAAILGRASVISYRGLMNPTHASVEYVFRHDPASTRVNRVFDGRIWTAGAGTYHHCSVDTQGAGLQITVEDIGS